MYENRVYRYTVPQRIYTFFQWRKPWGQWLFYGFGVWPWLPPCIPGSETGCCWSASRSEPLPYSAGVLQHHHALLGGLLVRFNSLSNNWIRSIPKPGFFPEYVGKYGQVANFPLTIHQFWACACRHPIGRMNHGAQGDSFNHDWGWRAILAKKNPTVTQCSSSLMLISITYLWLVKGHNMP